MEGLLEFLPCVYAFVACAGFCVLFNIHGPGIFFCSLGGALGWLAYLLAKGPAGGNDMIQSLVAALVISAESDVEAQSARGEESRKRAALYDWDEVASGYEALARRLALEGPVRRRPSGRRTGKAGW